MMTTSVHMPWRRPHWPVGHRDGEFKQLAAQSIPSRWPALRL